MKTEDRQGIHQDARDAAIQALMLKKREAMDEAPCTLRARGFVLQNRPHGASDPGK